MRTSVRSLFPSGRSVTTSFCLGHNPCRSSIVMFNQLRRASALSEYAHLVLTTSDPLEKADQTLKATQEWETTSMPLFVPPYDTPDTPAPPPFARPEEPKLLGKRQMPNHKTMTEPIPVILLHSLAHIELNAVDLGWDLILRFRDQTLPREFYTDWLRILSDEARHFKMLGERLQSLDSYYGALPAHDSLIEDCELTSASLKDRLAVIQLIREARGLDSWHRLVSKFNGYHDHRSAKLIDAICRDEVFHVDRGIKWFKFLCEREGRDPVTEFHAIVKKLDMKISPPFNKKVRQQAGMEEDWYIPIQHIPTYTHVNRTEAPSGN